MITTTAKPSAAEVEVAADWEVGDNILGMYEVTALLGAGSMGKVHQVRHVQWDLSMAVKSPLPAALEEGVDAFVKEAQTWVHLGLHPHIVVCYYVRVLGGIPRLFTELVTGGDLAHWIHGGRLYLGGPEVALERIIDVAIQTAWGLQHAHEHQLVHQDVKPANVLLLPDGTAKVTDFGIAEYTRVTEKSGSTMATLAYASPEQLGGRPISTTSDVWSWGVMVMEMFARRWPSMGPGATLFLEQFLAGETDDGVHPLMPPEIADLLGLCFSQDPDYRPRHMTSVADVLLGVYEQRIGKEYPRPRPGELDLRADHLSNLAVSLLDLGQADDARRHLDAAVLADPWHLQASFNREIFRWRAGDMTDEDLLDRLREMQTARTERWTMRYLTGLVHMERGDADSAVDDLMGADREAQAEENAQARVLIEETRQEAGNGHRVNVLHCREPQEAAAAGPDGVSAASAGAEGVVYLWDLEKNKLRKQIKLHNGLIHGLHISPDGTVLGSAGADGVARLVDMQKGRLLQSLSGHRGPVHCIAVADAGRLVVTGSEQGVLRFWDSRGKLLRSQDAHHGAVKAVALTADTRRVASVSEDGRLAWWDVQHGTLIFKMADHTGPVHAMALTPDGLRAITGGEDGLIKLWDMEGGECIGTLSGHHGPVRSLSIRPDGKFAVSVGDDATFRLWELSPGRCLYTVRYGTGWLHAVSMGGPEWSRVVAANSDLTLQVWDLNYATPHVPPMLVRPRSSAELIENRRRYLYSLVQVDGWWNKGHLDMALESLVVARAIPGYERSERCLGLWGTMLRCAQRVRGHRAWVIKTLEGHHSDITGLALSKEGDTVLTGSADSTLRAWDLTTGECILTLAGQRTPVQGLMMNEAATCAISFGEDADLVVWDLTCGAERHRLSGHLRRIRGATMTPDGRIAASVAQDGKIRVWDVESGKALSTMKGLGEHLAITPDARVLAMATNGGRARIYEVRSSKCLQVLRGHVGAINDVALTPDARLCVTAGEDGTVQVFDLVNGGRRVAVLEGHNRAVLCVDVTRDGRHIISGGRDRTLRLWCIEDAVAEPGTTPAPVRLMGHNGPVTGVKMNHDASEAVSCSADGLLRQWHLDWELKTHPVETWSDGANPCLEAWMAVQSATSTHRTRPLADRVWTDEDFVSLEDELSCWGFGYLHPDGIRERLLAVAPTWEGMVELPATNIHEDE